LIIDSTFGIKFSIAVIASRALFLRQESRLTSKARGYQSPSDVSRAVSLESERLTRRCTMARPKDFVDVVSKIPGVKVTGSKAIAPCPLPGHKTPQGHLTITDGGDKALITDQGGRHTYQDICQALGFDSLTYSPNGNGHEAKILASYDYTDAEGKLLYQVVRYDPKDFRQRWPDGNGGWLWNVKGIKPALYRLPEIPQAVKDERTVYIPEGEKDCDNLWAIGLVSTTNSGGADKWRPGYSEALKGASVVIIPDRDAPGQRHAAKVAASLHGKAKSVKVLELPDRDGHQVKDVSDWLAAGGTLSELERLASEAPEWKPPKDKVEAGFRLTKLADLLQEPDEDIAYLWENTLIKGGLSILVAKPKVGKSTLSRNLAYALAKGEPSFLRRTITSSGSVVYLALEEKRSEVKKHFERMGATENLPIFIHTGSAPEQAIDELRKAIIESKALLAIVDPLQRLIRIADLNDYSKVSLALEPLMQIARETGCHILLIHHANKGIARESGDSILGSTAIFGSVDCALIMKRGESYRTIESIQRYGEDIPRTVLAFDVGSRLTSSGGSLEDVEVAECGKAIMELLIDHEMTEKEIKEGITDHKGGTVSKSLRLLCREDKIQRQGLGKKGDPYQYATVPRNAGDSRDEYIEIPTIPTIPTIDSSCKSDRLPKIDDTLNAPIEIPTIEAVLGMSVPKAIEIWRSEGAPVIHLGPGENCEDLAQLLSNHNVKPEHLQAVRAWLEKVLKRRGEA